MVVHTAGRHYHSHSATCNVSKSSHQLPDGLLQPLPIPQRPWFHIAIDFITDLPLSRGHTTILTVIDRFSKACRLIPLPKLPTALETTESLCDHVFRFYGLAEDIWRFSTAWYGTVRFGTVHFWGFFHWVLYLVPDTFLVPLRSRF